MNESILKRRFGEFSTSDAFVKLKIKNIQTQEIVEIVCLNQIWVMVALNKLKLVDEWKKYTDYMIKNYDNVFELDNALYNSLKIYQADDSFQKEASNGWEWIKATYLERERGFYNIKDKKLEKNYAFFKMLLDLGVVLRQDCYDGSTYVQE